MADEKGERDEKYEELGTTYHRGPVILRGPMIPSDTTTGNLLAPEDSTDWLHMDPWRVLRIQAEFVDGFGALAELGPAVTVFGSARTPRTDPLYRAARHVGRKLAQAGRLRQMIKQAMIDERSGGRDRQKMRLAGDQQMLVLKKNLRVERHGRLFRHFAEIAQQQARTVRRRFGDDFAAFR